MKNAIKEWIHDNFGNLTDGQDVECRGDCACYRRQVLGTPAGWECGLGVRREGGALSYNCFKPTCPVGGGKVRVSIVGALRGAVARASGGAAKGSGGTDAPSNGVLELPQDFVPYVTGAGKEWLSQRLGVSDSELAANRIGMSQRTGQVVVPVYLLDGTLGWYQQRRYIDGDGQGPKWTSPKGHSSPIYVPRPVVRGSHGIITEDALSAIRCGREAPSAALLGTSVSDRKLSLLLNWGRTCGIQQVLIVLDGDAAGREKAAAVAKRIRPYFHRVRVLDHRLPDPKYWTEQQVKDVLDAASKTNKSVVNQGQFSQV